MEETVADLTGGEGFQGTRASTLFKGLTEARRNNKNQFRDRDPTSFHIRSESGCHCLSSYLTCQQALQEASRERTRERSRQDRSREESFCRGADSRLPQMESLLAGYFLLFYL